ncbi:methanogenesis marker 9 domain-containing protein [Methanolinea mesophila]|uniref:methanogenesis marker 9 domain-containing protein n=1 Tax=Methanolinea mesophila TaxID=547055 RepID=UPI001AE7E25A|nr:methanogenesis marker 9 domain-containing protein [Methanolinea mesophila]
MRHFQRFGLVLNDRVVRTPVAIASMAGVVNADYVLARADHVGVAFIGGYSIDAPTMEASREMARAGRAEFSYEDPVEELASQMEKMKESDVVLGLNLRGSTPAAYAAVAEALGDSVIYEIDAHCRQQPMIDAGCGEALLHNQQRLAEIIAALKAQDVTVSVKIRTGVAGDDRQLAKKIWTAGADILHADLMDFGYQKVRQLRNACPLVLIANNSVNTFEKMKDMFSHGADLVSLARHSDERTLAGLDAAITRYADEHGWYNSPKQLCRGGDIRSLAFCCMPVKSCPLIPTLDKIGMTRDEYMAFKQHAVVETPLSEGKHTCFGSLAWCCKDSSPCMFREMTIRQVGIDNREYMRQKHILADKILQHLFYEKARNDTC